jgi:hypothetical protein
MASFVIAWPVQEQNTQAKLGKSARRVLKKISAGHIIKLSYPRLIVYKTFLGAQPEDGSIREAETCCC